AMVASPVIFTLGPSALETAKKIAGVTGGEIRGLSAGEAGANLGEAFAQGRPILGICAAGILIRLLAPHLNDKTTEPPVIAISDDGASVVPLLGGHHGANELAQEIAATTGGHAAITTAGDVRFGVALDFPPEGYLLANPHDAKPAMAALLSGGAARLEGDAPWLSECGLSFAKDAEVELTVTNKVVVGSDTKLVYHPKNLVIGVGCARACPPEEMIALVDEQLAKANLAPASVGCVASINVKADEVAVHYLAEHLGVLARFFSAAELNKLAPRLANPSDVVLQEVGCPGVAEGAALGAVGDSGRLIVEKTKTAYATCAIAEAPELIDALSVGRARGRLSVVGIGPGNEDWRSGEAGRLLAEATDWVGYGLYLDIVAALSGGKCQHRFDLGAEEARVRHGLELAGEGRDVALVCSGDAGIYAMASLVFELCDGEEMSECARRAEIVVAPGISAFQAAAARAGAPIGHDFCAISLSDLLTPWEVIEARVKAAAEGDFVIAFYNPKSMRRTTQITRAMEILSAHRPPETPIILGTNLGREGENVRATTIAKFDADEVDMLTLVMVGSSTSCAFETGEGKTWVYTPRGYTKKREAAQ
ncbi:MAG: precorrin-3B C(17)-methyltransferase, partial [Hyphomicrobiales bacterium]